MRLGMMQPYFFPYPGYFGLIHATDCWVVFDTPQYIRRGWVNRNRILADGRSPWKYARVPVVRADRSTSIRDIRIDTSQPWQNDLLNSLDVYRTRNAPFFQQTADFVRDTLSLETDHLSVLLIHCLRACCRRLQIDFNWHSFSEMNLPLPDIHEPGEWALHTSAVLGATSYINPPGGRDLFDQERFQSAGIQLHFLEPVLPEYHQGHSEFHAGLSIIDAMMWNDPDAVRNMVSNYKLAAA